MHTRLDKLEAAGTINRVRHLAPPAGVRVIVDGDEIYAAEDQVLAVEQGHRALSKPAGSVWSLTLKGSPLRSGNVGGHA